MSYTGSKNRKTSGKSAITITFAFPDSPVTYFEKVRGIFVEYKIFIIGFFFLASILLFSFPYLYTHFIYPTPYSKPSKSIVQKGPIVINNNLLGKVIQKDPPTHIIIPSLSIDLPVIEAPVINGYWETSDTSASHGVGSAVPGQDGNMVIFAHARQGLFLPLRNITNGADIYVMTKNKWYQYKVVDTKLVYPNQTEVISPTHDQTLTLYTCDGYFDEKRFIAVAKPVK